MDRELKDQAKVRSYKVSGTHSLRMLKYGLRNGKLKRGLIKN